MMTTAVFLLVLVRCYLVISAELQNGEAVPGSPINGPSVPAADVQAHVSQFMNTNPGIAASAVSPVSPDAANKCECGVFSTETPAETDKPILTQAPMAVSCDEAGKADCNKLCSALAEAAKERGPQLLCATLGHSDKLKASVHSRVCSANVWTYTGLTAPVGICCHDHQVIQCVEQIDSPPANQP